MSYHFLTIPSSLGCGASHINPHSQGGRTGRMEGGDLVEALNKKGGVIEVFGTVLVARVTVKALKVPTWKDGDDFGSSRFSD
ncbi:hypothetical protein V6N13_023105 [Hibiscus sabdariffa]|uniref:Uncharacterized protein n=2 Tax=Hibiscus sabdariffa TaxID=183260 RepID=A0ABR2NWP0_9ROSI